jgi:HK97 family phage prohead protease
MLTKTTFLKDDQINATKTIISDLDDVKGIVKAYANVYDFEDSDGDISAKGSFKRTVNNNWKRMRVLKDHKTDISLGIPLEANAEDPYGLATVTQFFMHKELAKDMYYDIKMMTEASNPLNAELSIGYAVMERDKTDRRVITEYKLMEYSFLTSWAANALSIATDLKSVKDHYAVMELLTKMYDVQYSDPRLKQIEIVLQSLSKSPSEPDTIKEDPIDVEQIKNSLKQIFEKNHVTNFRR